MKFKFKDLELEGSYTELLVALRVVRPYLSGGGFSFNLPPFDPQETINDLSQRLVRRDVDRNHFKKLLNGSFYGRIGQGPGSAFKPLQEKEINAELDIAAKADRASKVSLLSAPARKKARKGPLKGKGKGRAGRR